MICLMQFWYRLIWLVSSSSLFLFKEWLVFKESTSLLCFSRWTTCQMMMRQLRMCLLWKSQHPNCSQSQNPARKPKPKGPAQNPKSQRQNPWSAQQALLLPVPMNQRHPLQRDQQQGIRHPRAPRFCTTCTTKLVFGGSRLMEGRSCERLNRSCFNDTAVCFQTVFPNISKLDHLSKSSRDLGEPPRRRFGREIERNSCNLVLYHGLIWLNRAMVIRLSCIIIGLLGLFSLFVWLVLQVQAIVDSSCQPKFGSHKVAIKKELVRTRGNVEAATLMRATWS